MERLTVNLTPRASASLAEAVRLSGDTETDALNRAVTIYAYFEQIRVNGGAVYVRPSVDEEITQLLIF